MSIFFNQICYYKNKYLKIIYLTEFILILLLQKEIFKNNIFNWIYINLKLKEFFKIYGERKMKGELFI